MGSANDDDPSVVVGHTTILLPTAVKYVGSKPSGPVTHRQDGCGSSLLDSLSSAVTVGPETPAHRVWADNPFQQVIVALGLDVADSSISRTALTAVLSALRNDGGVSPFTAVAQIHLPRSADDLLFCLSQSQSAFRPGGLRMHRGVRRKGLFVACRGAVRIDEAALTGDVQQPVFFNHPACPAMQGALNPDTIRVWESDDDQRGQSWTICNHGHIQDGDFHWALDAASNVVGRHLGSALYNPDTGA